MRVLASALMIVAAMIAGPARAPDVTAGQFYDVVVKDLRDHPGMRGLPASFLAGAALGMAFPCKQ